MTAARDPRVLEGAILFGRYAFPPNRLGYCGPDNPAAILQYVAENHFDAGLLDLERRFDGAYPYLQLIAEAAGIADPFDRRVVEAYWVGNATLERVAARPFYDHLAERFRPRMSPGAFRWLSGTLEHRAVPHHNFHVLDVYLKAGLLRDERAAITLPHMDRCRISWGRVLEVGEQTLTAARRPLELRQGRLALAEAAPMTVTRRLLDRVAPGDIVSIHWDWACDVLTPAAARWLARQTLRSLENANLSL
jgi:hypothetical protein